MGKSIGKKVFAMVGGIGILLVVSIFLNLAALGTIKEQNDRIASDIQKYEELVHNNDSSGLAALEEEFEFMIGKSATKIRGTVVFDLPSKITKDAPPVFMFATAEDLLTPSGVLAVANKYSELGLPYELHIFQHGPHGMGLGNEVSADGSSQILNSAFAHWQPLSSEWMKKVYGQPQFEDKSTGRMFEHLAKLGITFQQPEVKDGTKFA